MEKGLTEVENNEGLEAEEQQKMSRRKRRWG